MNNEPMKEKVWTYVKATPDGFRARLLEAVGRVGGNLETGDGWSVTLEPTLVRALTIGRPPKPADPITYEIPMTVWQTRIVDGLPVGAASYADGSGIQFEISAVRNGTMRVTARCFRPHLAAIFDVLIADMEQAVEHADFTLPETEVLAPSTSTLSTDACGPGITQVQAPNVPIDWEETIKQGVLDGKTDGAIGAALGLDRTAVAKKRKLLNLASPHKQGRPPKR